MVSVREKYVAEFGEESAAALEAAAEDHANGPNSENRGSDPFKWVLLICIGYQCAEVDRYRESHGIASPDWETLRQWIIDHGELASHDGDCDYLSLMCGKYNEYAGVPA